MVERKILLNPGPATTTDSVKYAQVVPDICPREKEFGKMIGSVSRDLIKIAGGDEDYACILIGGSGTAGMDCAMNSVVNGRVLIINNGAYGQRFIKIAQAYSLDFKELFFDWNEEIIPSKVDEFLKNDREIKYVVMVHHETTTGILNPIEEIGRIVKNYGCVFIVDAISSFAGVPLNVKESNIDFMISTSNKCIQGMPGVCFIICKRDELEKTKKTPRRSFYLDMYKNYEYFRDNLQTPFTPPVQTLYALRAAIDEFLGEGAEKRHARYAENCEVLVRGMERMGFRKIFEGFKESKILTTFWEPLEEWYSFDLMHDLLFAKGFTIYPGKTKERTFRLANMGSIGREDIEAFLNAMRETIEEMKKKSY